MAVKHISECLKELYRNKAREVLNCIANDGIESVALFEELNFLLQVEVLSHSVVYSAIDNYEINRIRNN